MTPAARLSAGIELLDSIIAAARDAGPAADTVINRYFRDRRYAGSGDRRAIRELVFRVVRALGERPESGRAAVLGYARAFEPDLLDLFGTGVRAPPPIAPGEPEAAPGLAPAWLVDRLGRRFGSGTPAELQALLARAPLDLRVNRLKTTREDVLALLPDAVPTPFSPDGLRLESPRPVENDELYRAGVIEVQDEGSQLAALAARVEPGMTVVDLCAGGGGKTLALAAAMANRGRVVACDVDRARLSQLGPRAERAGATVVEIRLLDAGREAGELSDLVGAADVVFVDAPCSGTGTWRRNPEARWRLTSARLERLASLQSRLLDLGATLTRPGGRLVYVVCSLLVEEGEEQVESFLARHPGWRSAPAGAPGLEAQGPIVLTPRQTGTDGFFIAALTPML